MVLSKRERLVAIATLGAVGILALDRLAITPLMAANDDLNREISSAERNLRDAKDKIDGQQRRSKLWAQMQNKGLRRKDSSEAESQMLNNIREWAQDAGMTLVSVKPERAEVVAIKPESALREKKVYIKSTFRVTGSGGMSQISRFLGHVETAEMPASIADVMISARKEATDDLSLQAGISTICLLSDSERDQAADLGGVVR